MLTLLLSLALNADPVTLALPGLNAVNLARGEGELYAELISQKFIERGLKVMTARDLQELLGLERQKQLLGCSDESSCIVEMTGAIGATGVLVGDLGKLGTEYVLNLKVLASKDGSAIALFNGRAKDAQELGRVIDDAVRVIVGALATRLNRPELAPKPERPAAAVSSVTNPVRRWAIAPAALGVVGLGIGAGLQIVAGDKFTQLSKGRLSQLNAAALRDSGRGLDTGGTVALVAGGVALAAAGVMFLIGADSVAPTVSLTPTGGAIGIAGVFP